MIFFSSFLFFDRPLFAEIGTDMFELDVHITADEEVVIVHDNDLERLTGHFLSSLDDSESRQQLLSVHCVPLVLI